MIIHVFQQKIDRSWIETLLSLQAMAEDHGVDMETYEDDEMDIRYKKDKMVLLMGRGLRYG